MGNQKYIFNKHEADTQSTFLTRQGGGAVLSRLKDGIVIGIWHKDEDMSKGGKQNTFDCAMRVEDVAKMLRDKGY